MDHPLRKLVMLDADSALYESGVVATGYIAPSGRGEYTVYVATLTDPPQDFMMNPKSREELVESLESSMNVHGRYAWNFAAWADQKGMMVKFLVCDADEEDIYDDFDISEVAAGASDDSDSTTTS